MANLPNYSPPPGSRFLPSDVESLMYYLKRKVTGRKFKLQREIPDIKLNDFSPSEVREMSYPKTKDLEGFFFCSLGSRYSNGKRINRSSKCGYWKATAKDKDIYNKSHKVGWRKTLTFYRGKAKENRTNWRIHEYRLEDKELPIASNYQNEFVLCKIFEKKSRGPKTDEDYESPVEEDADDCVNGDDENGSLVTLLPAIPSSSLAPQEGQNTVATTSTFDFENEQEAVLPPPPPHTATPIIPWCHLSSPGHVNHKFVLNNVSDEGGNTCNESGSHQVDSVPNESTGVDVDTDDINGILDDIIDSWEKEVLSQGLTGWFLEEEDLNKPMEDEEG